MHTFTITDGTMTITIGHRMNEGWDNTVNVENNEDLRAGRGKGFTMPKRQFIGDHPTVRKAIVEKT